MEKRMEGRRVRVHKRGKGGRSLAVKGRTRTVSTKFFETRKQFPRTWTVMTRTPRPGQFLSAAVAKYVRGFMGQLESAARRNSRIVAASTERFEISKDSAEARLVTPTLNLIRVFEVCSDKWPRRRRVYPLAFRHFQDFTD